MSVVNTNSFALFVQHAIGQNERFLSKTISQLSTGRRISSAADDSAGLAIGNRLSTQIASLNQAARNSSDAISLLKSADGSLSGISDIIYRMRELAVQSVNDTYTNADREALDSEYQELMLQINQIGNTTQWNGIKFLDGSFSNNSGNFSFQVGANENQTTDLTIQDFRTTTSEVDVMVTTTANASIQTSLYEISALDLDFNAGMAENPPNKYALENTTISVNINGAQLQVTLDKDLLDTVDDTTTDLAELVVLKFEDAFDTEFGVDSGLTFNSNTGTIGVFSVESDGDLTKTFSTSIAVNDGALSSFGSTDIKFQSTANTSINSLDIGLKKVNQQRAQIGAVMNRLTHSENNALNASLNLNASYSQIMDTDYAQATADLAKRLILDQAGAAMLTQANQQPHYVLALLT